MGISLALILWNSLPLRGLSKLLGPDSVFSAGWAGVSSVEAWFSISLDIEQMLSDARQDALHVLCSCCHPVIRRGGQEHFGLCAVTCWVAWWFRRDFFAYHGQGRLGTGLVVSLDTRWRYSSRVPSEHDFSCCTLCALVEVSCTICSLLSVSRKLDWGCTPSVCRPSNCVSHCEQNMIHAAQCTTAHVWVCCQAPPSVFEER